MPNLNEKNPRIVVSRKLRETILQLLNKELIDFCDKHLLAYPNFETARQLCGTGKLDDAPNFRIEKVNFGSLNLFINNHPQVKKYNNDTKSRGFAATLDRFFFKNKFLDKKKNILNPNLSKIQLDNLNRIAIALDKEGWYDLENSLNILKNEKDILSLLNVDCFDTILMGSYFSVLNFGIKRIILALNQNENSARIWGFHDYKAIVDDHTLEYIGDFEFIGNYISVNTKHIRNGTKNHRDRVLNLLLNFNRRKQAFKSGHYIAGNIQGCSINDKAEYGVLSFEVLFKVISKGQLVDFLSLDFVNQKSEPCYSPKEEETIGFYLVTKRNSFRIREANAESKENLKTKGIPIYDYIDLEGKYLIWNYGNNVDVMYQSTFEIKSDGTAYLCPPLEAMVDYLLSQNKPDSQRLVRILQKIYEKLKKQSCVINISRLIPGYERLVAVTFAKDLHLFNIASFDIGEVLLNKWAMGAFNSIGYGVNGTFISKYLIYRITTKNEPLMKHLDRMDNVEFSVGEVKNGSVLFNKLKTKFKFLDNNLSHPFI